MRPYFESWRVSGRERTVLMAACRRRLPLSDGQRVFKVFAMRETQVLLLRSGLLGIWKANNGGDKSAVFFTFLTKKSRL